jgi:hypothetical protein
MLKKGNLTLIAPALIIANSAATATAPFSPF